MILEELLSCYVRYSIFLMIGVFPMILADLLNNFYLFLTIQVTLIIQIHLEDFQFNYQKDLILIVT